MIKKRKNKSVSFAINSSRFFHKKKYYGIYMHNKNLYFFCDQTVFPVNEETYAYVDVVSTLKYCFYFIRSSKVLCKVDYFDLARSYYGEQGAHFFMEVASILSTKESKLNFMKYFQMG